MGNYQIDQLIKIPILEPYFDILPFLIGECKLFIVQLLISLRWEYFYVQDPIFIFEYSHVSLIDI